MAFERKLVLSVICFILLSCDGRVPALQGNLAGQIDQVVSAHDRNRDGCLSRAEWVVMREAGDAALKAELPGNVSMPDAPQIGSFERFDLDRNGCVTREEYADVAREEQRLFDEEYNSAPGSYFHEDSQ